MPMLSRLSLFSLSLFSDPALAGPIERLRQSPAARQVFGLLLSAAILLWLLKGIGAIGWHTVAATLPTNPRFYLFTLLGYLTWPVTEYCIFRRWWPLRPPALALFVKKRVLNDAVFGYSGDAWFFWRTRRANQHLAPKPLAAIKDVAIMSALAGNLATLAMLALALLLGGGPAISAAFAGDSMLSVGIGFAFVLLTSGALLLFSRRVMSLSARENSTILTCHSARLLLAGLLLLAAWSAALPAVPWNLWVLLGALRMVITRLPFLPNKELLFAALVVNLGGSTAPAVAALMAVAGALHLLAHIGSYALSALVDNTRTQPASLAMGKE